jgi:predicted transcriptional regulator
METTLRPTSYRLSEEARRLLALVAKKLHVSQSGIIELAIRAYAQKKGVQ